MLTTERTTLLRVAGQSSYHEPNKKVFKRLALKFLREIVKELDFLPKSVTVHFNPGGIACSGDAILHHDDVYLYINGDSCIGGQLRILGRTCKGQKDYTGGRNQWFVLKNAGDPEIVRLMFWVAGIRTESQKLKEIANAEAA
jgi:hypothetical protein